MKSSTVQKHHGDHLHAEKGRDKVQHNTGHNGDHLHVEEGKDQVKLNPECHLQGGVQLPPEQHVDHLHGGEGEDQVQLPPKKRVDHL